MKTFFLIILSIFLNFHIFSQNTIKISGKIENATNYTKISLQDIISNEEIVTTSLNKKGKFSIKVDISVGGFYRLVLDEDNYILLVLEDEKKIKLEADFNDLFSPKIKGSKNSSLIYKTFLGIEKYNAKLDSLVFIVEKEKKDFVKNMIDKNINSLANLFFIDHLTMEEDFDYFIKIDSALNKKYPENVLVQRLHESIEEKSYLAIGTPAPEINLKDINDKEIALSSLKGKVVLIDFWASWCRPCREKSSELVSLQKDFKDKNFQIYAVALDQSKELWKKAIKKDKLNDFIHVSDLKYWQSEVTQTYKFDAIPYNVLIDTEGNIIAKNMSIEEIRNILKEICK